ncbi:MAG: hypothetical protein SFY81_01770 [Verrucomicrobiota bacterium]|nr:hypothetical protein [Verrucomicrobiota bacterium]
MSPATTQLRRATLDDLGQLKKIWAAAGFAVDELEKRFTEFQIATREGTVIGMCGLLIQQQQGLLHHEYFTAKEEEAELRSLLWERILNIAKNHGLLRVWVKDSAPFWREKQFAEPSGDLLQKLPAGSPVEGGWLTLKLKEESSGISLEREFELFTQAQREESEKALKQARGLRIFAFVLVMLFLAGIAALAFYTFIRVPLKR